MLRHITVCLLAVLSTSIAAVHAAGDGPDANVPELKVLEYYIGTWDDEIKGQDLPFTKGHVTGKWILNGRFVEQSGDLMAQDGTTVAKITTLMTYDNAKRVYRSWTFISDGYTSESEGTWDAKTKVLTSVSRKDANGGQSITTADFSEAGVEKWKILFKDGSGQVVQEMTGINTRRKP